MRSVVLSLAAAMLLVSCSGDNVALRRYMEDYPQSQLRDVYKYCFQDRFGLEHLMNDSLSAVQYIEYELANADSADWDLPLFHYPLLDGNYVRVDINYVRQGIIPLGTLVSAMLHSTREEGSVTDEEVRQWRDDWSAMVVTLSDMPRRPLNFSDDSAAIDQLLASGQYAMHHSRLFNETYHQHYRIVRSDVFERELAPLIVVAGRK